MQRRKRYGVRSLDGEHEKRRPEGAPLVIRGEERIGRDQNRKFTPSLTWLRSMSELVSPSLTLPRSV